jgi:nitrite reductase/ring-hydroxylating ferredoxin subunit
MSQLISVIALSQFPIGQKKLVRHQGQEFALFHIEGALYAVANACPHSTGPLVEGRLAGKIVTCPWHGAQFDLSTGECCSGPATKDVATYPVHIKDGTIYVEIS